MNVAEFGTPSARWRPVPFWFWNGEMEDREIERQLAEMADKGLGGCFICARQGLTVPYLSKAWFRKVAHAVETAASLGLEIWLYDEYPYPSGMAGGEVLLEHPEAVYRHLSRHRFRAEGGKRLERKLPWGRVAAACAVPETNGQRDWGGSVDLREQIGSLQEERVFQQTGLTGYNRKRYFTYGPRHHLAWDVPDGTWDVIVLVEQAVQQFKYFGSYVDPCNAEAVRTFIRLTHEKYREHLGGHFGRTIKGMFTDEAGMAGGFPWSPRLGVDPSGLPKLLYGDTAASAASRYAYYQRLHTVLRDSYHRQIREWCDASGLQYVAEVPSCRMTGQSFSSIPGGDAGHEKAGRSLEWVLDRSLANFRSNPKAIASLAVQLGAERALIECFHSVGWSMTLQDAKWMIDQMAAMGITMFNFHAFFYTTDGLAKHDAPPSLFHQNPFWKHFRALGDYAGRVCLALSQGRPLTSVAVLDPVTSLWTRLGNPFHDFHYAGDSEEEERQLASLKDAWVELCKGLLLGGRDYDHLDPELLAGARIADGKLRIGRAVYSVLVIPPVTNLEERAWLAIKAFLAAGGTVVAAGGRPAEIIDGKTDVPAEFADWFGPAFGESAPERPWKHSRYEAYSLPDYAPGPLLALLEELHPAAVRIAGRSGGCRTELLHRHLELEDGRQLVFVANHGSTEAVAAISAAVPWSGVDILRLDLETGRRGAAAGALRNGRAELGVRLAPFESCLLELAPGLSAAGRAGDGPWLETAVRDMDGPGAVTAGRAGRAEDGPKPETAGPRLLLLEAGAAWRVEPASANLLRLGEFKLSFDGGASWSKRTVEPKTLIDQCSDLSGEEIPLPLAYRQEFGTPMAMSPAFPLACSLRAAFRVERMPGECRLAVPRGAIAGDHELRLNGERLVLDGSIDLEGGMKGKGTDIAGLLRLGENELVVRVTAGREDEGLLDCLYLAGDFGVRFDGEGNAVLGQRPETAGIVGVTPGYPYYAGDLVYRRETEAEGGEETEVVLSGLEPGANDAFELLVDGKSWGVRCWHPYRWRGVPEGTVRAVRSIALIRSTTLAGMYDGTYFDGERHEIRDVRDYGRTNGDA